MGAVAQSRPPAELCGIALRTVFAPAEDGGGAEGVMRRAACVLAETPLQFLVVLLVFFFAAHRNTHSLDDEHKPRAPRL